MHRVRRALLLPLQLALLVAAGTGTRVSAPRSLAWGPGLQAAAVLPVRYFFLQSVDSDGRNLTSSPPGQRPSPSPRVPVPTRGHLPTAGVASSPFSSASLPSSVTPPGAGDATEDRWETNSKGRATGPALDL